MPENQKFKEFKITIQIQKIKTKAPTGTKWAQQFRCAATGRKLPNNERAGGRAFSPGRDGPNE